MRSSRADHRRGGTAERVRRAGLGIPELRVRARLHAVRHSRVDRQSGREHDPGVLQRRRLGRLRTRRVLRVVDIDGVARRRVGLRRRGRDTDRGRERLQAAAGRWARRGRRHRHEVAGIRPGVRGDRRGQVVRRARRREVEESDRTASFRRRAKERRGDRRDALHAGQVVDIGIEPVVAVAAQRQQDVLIDVRDGRDRLHAELRRIPWWRYEVVDRSRACVALHREIEHANLRAGRTARVRAAGELVLRAHRQELRVADEASRQLELDVLRRSDGSFERWVVGCRLVL